MILFYEIQDDDIIAQFGADTLELTIDYTPGTPDVWYQSNGDPGWPGDPEELEFESICVEGSSEDIYNKLDGAFIDTVYEWALERAAEGEEV